MHSLEINQSALFNAKAKTFKTQRSAKITRPCSMYIIQLPKSCFACLYFEASSANLKFMIMKGRRQIQHKWNNQTRKWRLEKKIIYRYISQCEFSQKVRREVPENFCYRRNIQLSFLTNSKVLIYNACVI